MAGGIINNSPTQDSTIVIRDIRSDTMAEINLLNAQLFSLIRGGVDVIWPGGAPEGRRPKTGYRNSSPLMFPIVGTAPDWKVLIDGKHHPMAQHGIARDLPWELIESNKSSVLFKQVYDGLQEVPSKKGTISVFPRSYELIQRCMVCHASLEYMIVINNTSDKPMPYAVGWHPAFKYVNPSNFAVLWPQQNEMYGKRVPLMQVSNADDSVIEFVNSGIVEYLNNEFTVRINHNFGHMQIWAKKGEECVAVEPISARSLSRNPLANSPEGKNTELGLQPGYRLLEPGESRTYVAYIFVRPASETA